MIKHHLRPFCCVYFFIGVKVTLLKPELWLNRSQQLCRTCSPRPTKPWPTAGLRRQLFIWRERLSRRSAGLTILLWMTAVLVSLAPFLTNFLASLFLLHPFTFLPLLLWLNCRPYTMCTKRALLYSTLCCTLPNSVGFILWFWLVSLKPGHHLTCLQLSWRLAEAG